MPGRRLRSWPHEPERRHGHAGGEAVELLAGHHNSARAQAEPGAVGVDRERRAELGQLRGFSRPLTQSGSAW